MLSALVDVFRLRQYFDVATGVRELGGDLADDVGFLDVARRAVLRGVAGFGALGDRS